MSNYIVAVQRPEGSANRVEANVNGIHLAFIKGVDGRPREVSRTKDAMVHGSLYIRSSDYSAVMRQVSAILSEKPKAVIGSKPKQLGFVFHDEEHCPGCDKGLEDKSSCMDRCIKEEANNE